MGRTTSFPNFIWHYTCVPGEIGIRGSKDSRAGLRKYLRPTNERKQMSTKTMKQRIALVAVSALTAGLFSVVSAPVANANSLVLVGPAASRVSVATAISILGSNLNGVPFNDDAGETIKIQPGTLVQPTSGGLSENAKLTTGGGGQSTVGGSWPLVTSHLVAVTPGAAGSYSMGLYADLDGDGVVDSTEPRGTISWVTGSTPTQLIASQSTVSANVGSKVKMTYTFLDALNRKTLLVSGAGTASTDATTEDLESIAGALLVNVNASATAESILTADGGPSGVTTATAHTVNDIGTAVAGGAVNIETNTMPAGFVAAGQVTYAFGELGTLDVDAATGAQQLNASYDALTGSYIVNITTAAATGTITVQSAAVSTNATGDATVIATATDLTINLATIQNTDALLDDISLGISATQTYTDSVTVASTYDQTAAANTTAVSALKVDVRQPTVNFTVSKSGSTATFGVFVYRNATLADSGAGDLNVTPTAQTVNVTPTADLTQGFQRVTLVDGTATVSVTNLTPAAGEQYAIAIVQSAVTPSAASDNVAAVINVTYESATTSTTTSSISPASAVRKFGESTTMTVKVRDQFDNGIVGRIISYTVSGRNPVTTAVEATTNADGNAIITLNDTAVSTSTALTDTVSVDLNPRVAPSATTETLIITYNSVGSVVANVNLVDNVAGNSTIEYDSAPFNGTSAVTLTATVLDANGLGLPGVAVTVALPVGVSLIPTQSASGSTDASGQYTVGVYSNTIGTKSFTASAGGKTSSANTQKWIQGTADATAKQARFIKVSSDAATAKAEGIVQFVATATDLYGNPVAGVEVRLTENGVGRFLVQTGSNSTITAFTDSTGVVTADLTSTNAESGNNTITAAFTGNYSNAGTSADITGDGDYLSLAGYVGTSVVSGAAAGIEKATQPVTFGGGTAAVSNADVLKSIVALIASINKQIQALQKLILRR